MKTVKLLVLFLAVATLVGCGKDDPEAEDGESEKLIEIKSFYQTYSFGDLNSFKKEWENWTYDNDGRLYYSMTYNSFDYGDELLLPSINRYKYNPDGTINEIDYTNYLSRYIYRFVYDNNKNLTKKETWREQGLFSVETYIYDGDVKIETHSSSIINHEYDDRGNVVKDVYFRDENREPWFQYEYIYDSKDNLLSKKQVNFDRESNVIVQEYKYTYDDKGRISSKEYLKTAPYNWLVTYSYNINSEIESLQVKSKFSYQEQYNDWMYITYEYIYK